MTRIVRLPRQRGLQPAHGGRRLARTPFHAAEGLCRMRGAHDALGMAVAGHHKARAEVLVDAGIVHPRVQAVAVGVRRQLEAGLVGRLYGQHGGALVGKRGARGVRLRPYAPSQTQPEGEQDGERADTGLR